jgi:hypothetical protein
VNKLKKTKTITGVVLIFTLGVFCGALGDHVAYKTQIKKYMSGNRTFYQGIVVRNLSKKLNLDAVQREKVDGIVKGMLIEVQTIRKQYRPQIETVLERSRLEIKGVLRPDQIEMYDKVIAQHKAKADKNHASEE